MTKWYIFYALLAVALQSSYAQQCPPPGFPESGNTCPQAPILCENLDGYCNTINNNNVQQQFPGCSGQWTLNNDEWFAFYAGTTTITIVVTPSNCNNLGNLPGLQGGIYKGCGGQIMDVQCFCTEDPFVLTSNNYVVGEIYWFVLDGCSGDVCDYSIDVTAGSTVGTPPDDPGNITGPSPVCAGTTSAYSVPVVSGATNYSWTLTPPGIGTLNGGNDQSVNIQWDSSAMGTAELCLQVANACFSNPAISCQTIEVIPTPTATLSGGGSLCVGSSAVVDLSVSFSGVAPWIFTPNLNGIPQAPIQTTSNPYTFQVNQVGAWTISNVQSVGLSCPGTAAGTAIVALGVLEANAVAIATECGQSTGAIDLSVSGGNGVFTFHWSNGAMTEDLDSLSGGSYTVTVTTDDGCLLTYMVTVESTIRTETITFCPGQGVLIGGQTYTQAGTVIDTIPNGIGCDTIVSYTLVQLPQPTQTRSIEFCPGESVLIGGQLYNQPGTVIDTVTGTVGCDTIVTYTLVQLPQLTLAETIEFCPGDTIVLGGQTYTQPGTVTLVLPGITGCDTMATYTLKSFLPASSTVSIVCPTDISVIAEPGNAPLVVNYPLPMVTTDCPCPGVSIMLTDGLASGAPFPNATTTVCYTATDSCGQNAACCFKVTVREVQACDIKVNGCIRYELLSITADAAQNKTYRIKVVNNCPNKLIYTAIQLPNAIVAVAPPNLSVFTTEAGRDYEVRNPNYAPIYSIRFKSVNGGIANGESDVFQYTLPPQSTPLYINVVSLLFPQVLLEGHLNTFYCPVGVTEPGNRDGAQESALSGLRLFPNPVEGVLWIDLSNSAGTNQHWRILNSQGQEMTSGLLAEQEGLQRIDLPGALPNGLFFLEMMHDSGARAVLRFVLQR